MKNEELKDEKIIDMEKKPEEVEVVEKESKIKGIVSKGVAFGKKHGKKVLGIGALAVVGAISYSLGHKSNDAGSIMKDFEEDVDAANSMNFVDETEE